MTAVLVVRDAEGADSRDTGSMNAMKAFNADTVTMTSAHTGTRYRVQVLAIPETGISVVKGFRSATAALSHVPTLMEVFCCVSPGSCDLCSGEQCCPTV